MASVTAQLSVLQYCSSHQSVLIEQYFAYLVSYASEGDKPRKQNKNTYTFCTLIYCAI